MIAPAAPSAHHRPYAMPRMPAREAGIHTVAAEDEGANTYIGLREELSIPGGRLNPALSDYA